MNGQKAGSVTCSAQVTDTGVLCLAFEGYYPPGSEGSHVAYQMERYTLAAYNEHNPKAILLDFEKLDYVWGDGVYFMVFRLARERKELPLSLPVGFLAHGRTHEALKPLFKDSKMFFGMLGAKLFDSREKAMECLEAGLQGARLAH